MPELEDGEIESGSECSKDQEEDEIDAFLNNSEIELLRNQLLNQRSDSRNGKTDPKPKPKRDHDYRKIHKEKERRSDRRKGHVSSSRKSKSRGTPKKEEHVHRTPTFLPPPPEPPIVFFPYVPMPKEVPLFPPPPPPQFGPFFGSASTMFSHPPPNITDNYDSIDMDIEENESDQTENRRNSIHSRPNSRSKPYDKPPKHNPEYTIRQKLKSLEANIQNTMVSLEKETEKRAQILMQFEESQNEIQNLQRIMTEYLNQKSVMENDLKKVQEEKILQIVNKNNEDIFKMNELLKKETYDDSKETKTDEEPKETKTDEEQNNEPVQEDEEKALRERLLATWIQRSRSDAPQVAENSKPSVESVQEKGRNLLRSVCKFDLNGRCERGLDCKFLHLDDVAIDEKLMIETILRFIYAYEEEDIALATVQLLEVRPEFENFSKFVKSFFSLTMRNDEEIRNRFYKFYQ